MKPKLKTFPDLVKAADMIRTGRVRGPLQVERIVMRCFAKPMLQYKRPSGGQI